MNRLLDRLFLRLERVDYSLHGRGIYLRWLCRLVGKLEPGYYERNTDWDHPLYVNPERNPDLYQLFADQLCSHGYRDGCPEGCS